MFQSEAAPAVFRVSVVIPAYNAAATISETLASVTAQSHAPLEIIVVDDGSTDETAAIIREMQDHVPGLHLLTRSNAGVAAARNLAIAAARGELIAPLDADDLWHSSYLERIVARFRSAGPVPVLVYAHCRLIDARSQIIGTGLGATVDGPALHRMRFCNLVGNGSGMVVRRDALLAAGGYDGRLRAGGCQGYEDYLLQLRLSAMGSIGAVNAFLVGYRQRPDAMSADVERMARSETLARALAGSWTGPIAEPRRLARWREGTRLLIRAQALARSDRWAALRSLGQASLIDPVATTWAMWGRLTSRLQPKVSGAPASFRNADVLDGRRERPGRFARLQRQRLSSIAELDRATTWPLPQNVASTAGARVSVVLPVFNGEHFVEQAIRSILCQSFADFELIVGDDGSTDDTPRILARLQSEHPQIRLLRRPVASGLAEAANWVVAQAVGDLIAFIHADDLAHPQRLERQVAVLQTHPEAVLVGSPPRGIDPSGRQVHPPNLWRVFRLTGSAPFAHSSVVFRRRAFEAVGGYRSAANYWEDLDLFNRLATLGSLLVIPEALTSYRYGPQSTRSRDEVARVEYAIHCQYMRDAPVISGPEQRLHPRVFLARAWMHVWTGNRSMMVFRLLRRGRLRLNWHTAEALVFTTLAFLAPRVFRASLAAATYLRNRMIARHLSCTDVVRWAPTNQS